MYLIAWFKEGAAVKEYYAERVGTMAGGELGDLMRLVGRDDIISFAGGIPSPDVFPLAELKEITLGLFENEPRQVFQYSSTEGRNELKDFIVEFLSRRGVNTSREELIITSGSQQALDLVAKVLVDPGDPVLVEKPGYVGGIGALKSYQARILGIDMEEDGISIDCLEETLKKTVGKERPVKYIYLVPDYSNPSGARLSVEKRRKILDLAGKYNFYILEDTPYSELSYYEERLDYIKKYDEENRVIMLGSFSKFFVPGLRVAWVCAPRPFIELLSRAKQDADLASSTIGQLIITRAGEKGLVETQARKVREFYRLRLEAMGRALEKYFPAETSWFTPRGGFFFWVKLPAGVNSKELLAKTIDEDKVAFVPGTAFFADPKDGYSYVRLSFSDIEPAMIEEGIKRLGEAIARYSG
jgi:2-aminoadipate transaminase